MIILAFDLATSAGYCYGPPQETPRCGAVRAPMAASPKDYGVFGLFFLDFFVRLFEGAVQADQAIVAVYESPILPRARIETDAHGRAALKVLTTVQTSRKLGSMGVLLETAAEQVRRDFGRSITVRECQIQAIKNELAGHTKADKGEMVGAARRAGITLPDGKEAMDAADAFGAWLMAVRTFAPEHRAMWDQRLRAPMGQEHMTVEQARGLFGRR